MTNLHMTHAQIELLAAPFLAGIQAGFAVDASTVAVIDFPRPLALKYQRVLLAPGLYGSISSDDGKELTVKLFDVLIWLGLA